MFATSTCATRVSERPRMLQGNVLPCGEKDLVIVKEEEFANAAAGKHLCGHTADTPHADNDNRVSANVLVILDNAHALESHEARVGVVIAHLTQTFQRHDERKPRNKPSRHGRSTAVGVIPMNHRVALWFGGGWMMGLSASKQGNTPRLTGR